MDSSGCGSKVSGSGSMQMQRSQYLYQRFLTDAAAGLHFSHDSMVDLEAGSASYSQADFRQLFRPTGALKPSTKRKTQERKLYRPAPKPKGRQAPPEPFRDLLPLLESSPRLQTIEPLQGSCSTVQGNSSKYHNNLQRWSSPAPQRWTGPDKKDTPPNKKTVSTGSLKTDLTDLADQVHTAVLTSCSPTGPRPQSDCAGSDADGWMAAQCSALDGDHSTMGIQRLLAQLFLCQDYQPDVQDSPPSTQLVDSLLTYFSSQTTRVCSLLAEQLNSSEWRRRLFACTTLSSLKGPINKDVVHKLTQLMWSDEHGTVRLAAAEALMKLGKIHVYNELRLKLAEGWSLQGRMEVLDIISHLKLMTLHEPLVSCLRDEFTAVRKRACLMAERLLLKDEAVVSCLLELVESDPVQEVRLSAITAVGALGLSSSDVQETLLRCVESGEEAELRLAACRLLQSAGLTSAQLQDFLLQRVDVESNRLVRRTMKEVLSLCGCSLQEERCNAKYINPQLQRLCEYTVITEKVLLTETLQVRGSPGRSIRPGTLANLLNQHYGTDYNKTPDQY